MFRLYIGELLGILNQGGLSNGPPHFHCQKEKRVSANQIWYFFHIMNWQCTNLDDDEDSSLQEWVWSQPFPSHLGRDPIIGTCICLNSFIHSFIDTPPFIVILMTMLIAGDIDDHSDNNEIILPKRPTWQPASTHGPFTRTHPFIQSGQITNLTPAWLWESLGTT